MKTTLIFPKILYFACALNAGFSYAATVKKINKPKKLVTLELDPGEKVEKKEKMCFVSAENKKMGCGTVKKIKGSKIYLSVKSAKLLDRIFDGMQALPSSARSSEGASTETSNEASSGIFRKKVVGFISFGVLAPASYSKLIYKPENQPKSLWDSAGSSNSISDTPFRLGFGLQLAFPLKKFSINPGFRFRLFRPFEGIEDYVEGDKQYVETSVTASEIGLFADFQLFKKPVSKKLSFDGGAGLDLAIASVNFVAKKKNDSNPSSELELATAKSTLNVISLRLNGGVDFNFTPRFGLTSGAIIFVPLFATGGQPVGKFADNEAKGVADPGEDIKEKLAHKKSTLGAELKFGAFVNF